MKYNYFQIVGSIFLIAGVTSIFFIVMPMFDFQTYSPDSIRFIHFWQNSFSSAFSDVEFETFELNVFLSNIYDALHASNLYDLGRGRIMTYISYGIENILLYSFTNLPTNFLIVAIIIINSHGASSIISRNAKDFKFYVYALSFFVIAINSISFSPVMYFALYSKYICLSFILYFFVFKNSYLKFLMLLLAFFTDENSLLLSLMICFFYFLKFFLLKIDKKIVDIKLLVKNVFFSGALCLVLLSSFFLTVFVIFDTSPMQFARYAARGTMWLLDPENLLNKLIQLAWTLEILILGFSFENVLVLQIIGLLLLISFLYLSVLNFKNIREFSRPDKLSNYLIHFKLYPYQSTLIFWILTTILLFITLPSSQFAYQTYSYPIMLSLGIVILLWSSDKLASKKFLGLLFFVGCVHIINIPNMVENVNKSNQNYLFKDTSISSTDINKLQISINEIRINQNYELFQKLNNFQEIDFSGKWYYSLEQHYRFPFEVDSFGNCIEENNLFGNCIRENNYYPIYGNVRVLAWPYFDVRKGGESERQFSKNQPTYTD